MARKVSDMVLLLGSRGRARSRSKSGLGQVFSRVSQLVLGRSVKNERPAKGTWILPAIALLCFAVGYVVGGKVAVAKELAPTKELRTAGLVGEIDTAPISQHSVLVAYYNGLAPEPAKGNVRKLVTYLHEKGFDKARAREFQTDNGPTWGVVVYCIGERDLEATSIMLRGLPKDVPDENLVALRNTVTEDGLVWPFPLPAQ